MFDIRKIVKSRKMRDGIPYMLSFMPDKPYLRLYYFAMNGHILHLKNPKGYNEKLQWIKLHDKEKHSEHSILADKLRVRAVIEEKLGSGYSFPLLGYWESFDDIDFDALPNEFVLKCNHDSGSARLIHDKSALTKKELSEMRNFYNRSLKRDFFKAGREYPYKGIKPYIMAEKMMSSSDSGGIRDYKFFCFNGEPKMMLMISGREEKLQGKYREDYFDMNFNRLDVTNGWPKSEVCPSKPLLFEEMKFLATKLSQGIRQVRMDFYEIDGKVYFGEYTFFSGGGFELFQPEEWEYRLGSWIDLDSE